MTAAHASDLSFTDEERELLLQIARQGLYSAVEEGPVDMQIGSKSDLPMTVQEPRACFVTLQSGGELRGCTGTLEPRQSLANEVFESTIRTARSDPRFEPVAAHELPDIAISISVLTNPRELVYDGPADLIAKLRPGKDGVTLEYGIQRGTFLPQVWDKIGDPVEFLSRLCQKMGLPRTLWMSQRLKVAVYQAVEISEPAYKAD